MEFLPKENYKKILIITFYCLIGGLIFFVFFKYLLKPLLPFLIAWLVSLVIRPLSDTLHKRTGMPKKIISVLLVLFVLALLGSILFLLIDRLLYELRGIVVYITQNADMWINGITEYINKLSERFPILQSFGKEEEVREVLSTIAQGLLTKFTDNVPNMLKNAVTVLPNLLFVSLILIMASYYFCAEYDDIKRYFAAIFPLKIKVLFSDVGKRIKKVGKNVAKGYLLTMALTFLQLYIGFLILKTEYAFSVALIIALIDILPVIGVGTVLIPWAAVKIMAGSYYQGFGLLIIFAVVSVIREIVEPRIVGKSIGLHPLATLFAMYVGLEICGFVGIILFPVIFIALKTLFSKVQEN